MSNEHDTSTIVASDEIWAVWLGRVMNNDVWATRMVGVWILILGLFWIWVAGV